MQTFLLTLQELIFSHHFFFVWTFNLIHQKSTLSFFSKITKVYKRASLNNEICINYYNEGISRERVESGLMLNAAATIHS